MNKYLVKQKCIATISIALIMISIGLQTVNAYNKEVSYEIAYEYVDTKSMAQANIKTKTLVSENKEPDILDKIINYNNVKKTSNSNDEGKVESVDLPSVVKEEEKVEEKKEEAPKRIWYMPINQGSLTQSPHPGHPAYDMISPRGSDEDIYPIADGVISGIYTDSAGALVVTVLHDVNGVKYTSLYAHLSRYADGIYVGEQVGIYDSLGKMGTTGNSTGVHLHISVADCALFDQNDDRCSDLGKFYNYINYKVNQGDLGLGSLLWVYESWNER